MKISEHQRLSAVPNTSPPRLCAFARDILPSRAFTRKSPVAYAHRLALFPTFCAPPTIPHKMSTRTHRHLTDACTYAITNPVRRTRKRTVSDSCASKQRTTLVEGDPTDTYRDGGGLADQHLGPVLRVYDRLFRTARPWGEVILTMPAGKHEHRLTHPSFTPPNRPTGSRHFFKEL